MARSTRTWTQLEIREAPGAEPWVVVRYRGGCFLIPADASIAEAVRGVRERWTRRPKAQQSERYVRVPAAVLADLQRLASTAAVRATLEG